MKHLKIKLHSIVDLITNSSTVIYTYSDSCDTALKDLFNELKSVFNIKENIEDVFYISVLCEEYIYNEYLTEDELNINNYEINELKTDLEMSNSLIKALKKEELDHKEIDKIINKIIGDVQYNRIKKPNWMGKAENHESGWSNYPPDTYISLIPKEEKYEKIAKLFYDLIYSTSHEATRDS
jgi:hypothetical protein